MNKIQITDWLFTDKKFDGGCEYGDITKGEWAEKEVVRISDKKWEAYIEKRKGGYKNRNNIFCIFKRRRK